MTFSLLAVSPLISVVIPAFNAERFLGHTLASVLAQTYPSLEVLVVNDGSTDGTAALVKSFIAQDSRVHLVYQPNSGVAAARNLGIRMACGEFIAPLDADDLWHPQALENLMEALRRAGDDTALAYAWSVDIDEWECPLGGVHGAMIQGKVLKTLLCHNFIGNASATLLRRRCLDKVGDYDTSLRSHNAQGCEDWDLYLRLATQFSFTVAPQILVGYRKLPNSMSGDFSQMARSHALMLDRIKAQFPDLSPSLFHLSCSSFYLYFAHQCHAYGDPNKTLYWLRQAFQADPFTPLIRPGFYKLGLVSLVRIWRGREHSAGMPGSEKENSGLKPVVSRSPSPLLFPTYLAHPLHLQVRLQLKLFVGLLLHRILTYL